MTPIDGLFLLMYNINYGSVLRHFRHIWFQKMQPCNLGQRSLKVIETGTIW